MCAILGWIKSGKDLDPAELGRAREALNTMRHRGPDAQGEWAERNIFLGHNRLSIIDLSNEANQPFIDESGRYVLVFNGEVYNYIELRDELVRKGIVFRTNSDTEVVLKAFIYYGEAAFLKFDGMFAFALYDRKTRKAYLVRDFLGQKPLYYHVSPSGLVFASELRAILALKEFSWRIDRKNVCRFLLNSCFMGDTTPLEGVKKLPAGHYLVQDEKGAVLDKFWDSIPGEKTVNIGADEALSRFEDLFENSCKMSMRSDVPYGVFLSGGLDSSLVLDGCYRSNPDIAAFMVQMSERDFDESSKGDKVCGKLKIPRLKKYMMDEKAIQASIDACLDFSDEPHGDPGLVNAFFLARSCRKDITVGLAGDGADELFAGYLPFKIISQTALLRGLDRSVAARIEWLAQKTIPCSDGYMSLHFKLLSFLAGFPSQGILRLPLWLGAVSPESLAKLCPGEPRDFFSRNGEPGTLLGDFKKLLAAAEGKDPAEQALYFYQKFFLPEYVCMHTDRASMQSSLEVRSPFLSVKLIEFANRMPGRFKIKNNQLKWLLRESLRRKDYPEAICGQKKQGFTFPVSRWMKSVMRSRMEQAFSPGRRLFSLVDRGYVDELLQQHLNNRRNNYRILFNLLVLSTWLEKYPEVKICE